MPSIYNHENACWGIRRSSCDMFQYDFNEEFQTNKSRDLGCPPDHTNTIPNTTYVHYSVSSNGYYGYQPHKVTQVESSTNEIEMDVEDINATSTVPINNDNMSVLDCAALNPDLQHDTQRRKRRLPSDSLDSSKRIRQEECGGGSSLRHRRLGPSKVDARDVDYEATTRQLLRQTHGCELYLFERTCDY